MVGVINRQIAESHLLCRFSAEEVLNYIRSSSHLSLELIREGDTKRVFVTNKFWVNKRHQIYPDYSADWTDEALLQDIANRVAYKLGLYKTVVIQEL